MVLFMILIFGNLLLFAKPFNLLKIMVGWLKCFGGLKHQNPEDLSDAEIFGRIVKLASDYLPEGWS